MRVKRAVACASVVGLIAAAWTGCSASSDDSGGSGEASNDEILIAEVAPFTGPVAFYGEELHAAAQLAVEEYGGELKSRVKFMQLDDGCDPAKGVTAMRKALAAEPAIVLGPPCTAVVEATQKLAADAEVPHLIQALAPKLAEVGDEYLFRTIPNQNMLYEALSKYAREEMGLRKVAMLHGDDAYSESEAVTFEAAWTAVGGEIVGDETFATGSKDMSASLLRLRDADADAIFLGGYEGDVGLATKTARQLGFDQPILGGTPMGNAQYRDAAGDAADGVTYVASVNPGDRRQAEFFAKWKEAEGTAVTDVSASVFNGVGGLMHALKASDGAARNEELRDALRELRFETLAGIAAWTTPEGELAHPTVVIGRVKNGEATMLDHVER